MTVIFCFRCTNIAVVMSLEILLYLHVTANDCDLHHNPENNTWYLGIIFITHFSKMFACDQTGRK